MLACQRTCVFVYTSCVCVLEHVHACMPVYLHTSCIIDSVLLSITLARDDYKVDEDNLDYSVFAGGNPHYHTRIYTQKSIHRLSMAATPNTPGTPSRKKSMATYLANQLPESLIEEDENQESGSDTNISPPQPPTSPAEDVRTCTYVCTYVCMYVYMYVRMYVRMYVCTYVRSYVCSKSS